MGYAEESRKKYQNLGWLFTLWAVSLIFQKRQPFLETLIPIVMSMLLLTPRLRLMLSIPVP